MTFAWDDWNVEHLAKHNVSPAEAEYVVKRARKPMEAGTDQFGDMRYLVMGQTDTGRYLRVAFVFKSIADVDPEFLSLEEMVDVSTGDVEAIAYVIHAQELDDRQKKRFRKRK